MTHDAITTVRAAFAAIDAHDPDGLLALMADDVEIADEISKSWLRGLPAATAQVRAEFAATPEIRSELRDEQAREYGDTCVVTFAVRQRYELDGVPTAVDGPSVAVLRRTDGSWQIAVILSAPLPADA